MTFTHSTSFSAAASPDSNASRVAWSAFGSVQSDPYRWGVATLPGYTPPAISFTGAQVGIVTDSTHTKARIKNISTDRIRRALADGMIVVSDMQSGFWAFKMDGFDGWNGHDWGMPNISSAQDWDNGPEGAPKARPVT